MHAEDAAAASGAGHRPIAPRLGFLASHGGSGMRAVVAAIRDGRLPGATAAVAISNNSGSAALAFAHAAGIPALHLSDRTHPDPDALDAAIAGALRRHGAELVLLSGYMRQIGPRTLLAYGGRMLNIHPALLPAFGGRGMYGRRVHAAVLAAGVPVTGATVHLVDAEYDHGRVLAQRRIPVCAGDTVETLAARVAAIEGPLYVDVLRGLAAGDIPLEG